MLDAGGGTAPSSFFILPFSFPQGGMQGRKKKDEGQEGKFFILHSTFFIRERFFAVFSGIDSGGLQFLAPYGATSRPRYARQARLSRCGEQENPG